MLCIILKFYSLFKLPHMTRIERNRIKDILANIEKPRILEYGSGYSTLYFSKFLRKMNKKFVMYSVDNSEYWNRKVKELIDRNHLGDSVKAYYAGDKMHFARYPEKFSEEFNFILVDGRFRRVCLEMAPNYLADDGVVFLHDAERKHYHEPLRRYKNAAFYESGKYYPFEKAEYQYWIGSDPVSE